jgi:cytochrome c5
MRDRLLSFVLCNFLVWIAATATANAQQADIDKGRQVVAQTCAACHTTIVRMIQVHKQSAEQWKDTVYFMISRGAQIMPDEIEPLIAYLTATGGSGSPAGRNLGRGRPTAENDGAAIFQRTCQQCHELAVASKKPNSQDWTAVLARMINYGARLSAAEQEKLNTYLNELGK